MAGNGGTTTAPRTKKANKVERTPLEHAQRRVKEQISAIGANGDLPSDKKAILQDYLTGVSTLISNAPLSLSQFGAEPYATVIALGRAQRSAGDLFKKPPKEATA